MADALNLGPDGKLNVLGLGSRVLRLAHLPATTPLVVIMMVEADASEAAEYPLIVDLVEPDGTRENLVTATGEVPTQMLDPRVPTGFGGSLDLGNRPFRIEGVYRLEATAGPAAAVYVFSVMLEPVGEDTEAERSRPKAAHKPRQRKAPTRPASSTAAGTAAQRGIKA